MTKLEQADEIDWIETNKALAKEIIELKKQAEQEPVAWLNESEGVDMYAFSWRKKDGFDTPLYAAPVRTKDLTDKQIEKVWNKNGGYMGMPIDFARAVIAADREKNNANNNT